MHPGYAYCGHEFTSIVLAKKHSYIHHARLLRILSILYWTHSTYEHDASMALDHAKSPDMMKSRTNSNPSRRRRETEPFLNGCVMERRDGCMEDITHIRNRNSRSLSGRCVEQAVKRQHHFQNLSDCPLRARISCCSLWTFDSCGNPSCLLMVGFDKPTW